MLNMTTQLVTIRIERLLPHPANANRMSKATFGKLCRHIEKSGRYEPPVVRPHPQRKDCFEILNGCHRIKALAQLGAENVQCVVWDVDDAQALVLLATLNRLCGSDEPNLKAELFKGLAERFDTKALSKLLTESRRGIERLCAMPAVPARPALPEKAFLNPVCFFLNDEQKASLDTAIKLALDRLGLKLSAQGKATALETIAAAFNKTAGLECQSPALGRGL